MSNTGSGSASGSASGANAQSMLTESETEWYSDEDLSALNNMLIPEFWHQLHQRLAPTDYRLNHEEFCAFRAALMRDPTALAAGKIDEDYPGLFHKVHVYLSDPTSRKYLSVYAGDLLNYTQALEQVEAEGIPELEGVGDSGEQEDYSYDDDDDPDLVTGAIRSDCKYCVTWLYWLGIIPEGGVAFNYAGWSLLGLAVNANARTVIDILIARSGDRSDNDPGPFQPYRIKSSQVREASILKYAASVPAPANQAKDNCFRALLDWCDSLIQDDDDPRVKNELDSVDRYRLCELGSIELTNLLNDNFGVNLLTTAIGPRGKTIWHATIVHFERHHVFLTWLKLVYPEGINIRDTMHRTPLMYAVSLGDKAAVEWLLDELSPADIRSGDNSQGAESADPALGSAMDTAIESWNEYCVLIMRLLYQHSANVHLNQVTTVTKNLRQLIASLVNEKRNLENRYRNGTITKAQRQKLWREIRISAQRKCVVLVEDAPSDTFHHPSFRKCLSMVKQNGLHFLEYYMANNDATRRRLRSGDPCRLL